MGGDGGCQLFFGDDSIIIGVGNAIKTLHCHRFGNTSIGSNHKYQEYQDSHHV
jgi:hypothetical protein